MKEKILLVESPIECPNCGRVLKKGCVIYQGDKTTCGYCKEKEDLKKAIKNLSNMEYSDEEMEGINNESEMWSDWESSQL